MILVRYSFQLNHCFQILILIHLPMYPLQNCLNKMSKHTMLRLEKLWNYLGNINDSILFNFLYDQLKY
jgi:hypothetical protein